MNFDENNPFLRNLREIQELTKAAESQLPVQEVYLDDYPQTNNLNYGQSAIEKKAKEQYPELAVPLIQTENATNAGTEEGPRQNQSIGESGELNNLNSRIPFSSENSGGTQQDFSADLGGERTKESPIDYIRRKYNISSPDKTEELAKLQRKTDVLQSLSDIDKAAAQLGSYKTVLAKKMGYDVPEYKGGGLAKLAEREKEKFVERGQLEDRQRKQQLEDLSMGKTMMDFDEMLKNEEELNNPTGLLANTLKNAAKTLNVDLPEGITPKQILRVMPNITTLAEQRKTKLSEAEAEKELKKQQYEKDIELEMLKQKGAKELKQMELEQKKTAPTEGQKTTDKEFAKDYVTWVSEKGSISADKGIANVQEAIKEMQANPNLTGGFNSVAYALMPESLKSAHSKKIAKIETRLRSAVVDTLRPLLGSQFAAREGENIFKQTFDANQLMSENIARAQLVLQDLQNQVESRRRAVEYWEANNGSLRGYELLGDKLMPSSSSEKQGSGLTPEQRKARIEELRKKKGQQ